MSAPLPSVSVIVPVYNGEATIQDCLESLLNLDYPTDRLEVVVVDNGSTDRTPEILERFARGAWPASPAGSREGAAGGSAAAARRIVLSESTRGPGAARNRGLREATGAVLAFTDADCAAAPDWLAALVRPLDDPGVGVAAGRILAKRPATAIQRFSELLDDHAAATGGSIPSAITMNWASPAALIRTLGGFDESFLQGEDSDLAFRIFLEGHRFAYVAEAVVYHESPYGLEELMVEGYRHGMASVALDKKHAAARRSLGVPRIDLGSYVNLARDAIRMVMGSDRTGAACAFVFGAGKKTGRLVGSLRFRHVLL